VLRLYPRDYYRDGGKLYCDQLQSVLNGQSLLLDLHGSTSCYHEAQLWLCYDRMLEGHLYPLFGVSCARARALQRQQRRLLRQRLFRHDCYFYRGAKMYQDRFQTALSGLNRLGDLAICQYILLYRSQGGMLTSFV